MALSTSRVTDNSMHYTFHNESQKYGCKFCFKTFSQNTLNVNTRAAHLSDFDCAKKYKISLCRQVPSNISEANVVYINSIINPREKHTNRINNITQKTKTQISELTEEIESKNIPVIEIFIFDQKFSKF